MVLRGGITDAQIARARRLPPTVSYLVAVSAALVAAFARYALDPILGSKLMTPATSSGSPSSA